MKLIKAIAALAVFIGSLVLIITGQVNPGTGWLGLMLLGLAGLLLLLYLYNRRYTRADRVQKKKGRQSR